MFFDRVKSLDQILESAEKKGLKRQLGWFDLMMLGVGAIIGTGIFVLTSVAANKAGPGMIYSFIIAGLTKQILFANFRSQSRTGARE